MDTLVSLVTFLLGCLCMRTVFGSTQTNTSGTNLSQELEYNDTMLRKYSAIEKEKSGTKNDKCVKCELDLGQNIIEKILSNYDKRYPPLYNNDSPVEVKVQMYVVGVFGIEESQMKFSMSMYLRQQWTDPRLKYDAPDSLKTIELDNGIKTDIWVPDLSFMTDMETKFHQVTVPNKMMLLYPSGFVSYSTRVTGTFTCFMQLHNFPFDSQQCILELESYGFTAKTISFRWIEPAMTFKKGILHSQFEIGTPESYICDTEYPSGNYTCIGLTLPLKRRYGFYIIQVYAPSMLIVVLSWVSFWLNIDAAPARVSLGILTVLTISTNGNLSVGMAQQVSYIRAIDIWNAVCLLLVFGAMIEYAYVCMIARVQQRRKQKERRDSVNGSNHSNGTSTIELGKISIQTVDDKQIQQHREKARTIDKVSRFAFPLAFVIFNIIYWTLYLT